MLPNLLLCIHKISTSKCLYCKHTITYRVLKRKGTTMYNIRMLLLFLITPSRVYCNKPFPRSTGLTCNTNFNSQTTDKYVCNLQTTGVVTHMWYTCISQNLSSNRKYRSCALQCHCTYNTYNTNGKFYSRTSSPRLIGVTILRKKR